MYSRVIDELRHSTFAPVSTKKVAAETFTNTRRPSTGWIGSEAGVKSIDDLTRKQEAAAIVSGCRRRIVPSMMRLRPGS